MLRLTMPHAHHTAACTCAASVLAHSEAIATLLVLDHARDEFEKQNQASFDNSCLRNLYAY